MPADLVLLRTTETSGACFVRTDQLDGETDWKLRLAVPDTQKLDSDAKLFEIHASLFAERPQRDIHSFIGTFTRVSFSRNIYVSTLFHVHFHSQLHLLQYKIIIKSVLPLHSLFLFCLYLHRSYVPYVVFDPINIFAALEN